MIVFGLFQPEDALVELLQNLADMDITFQALKVSVYDIFLVLVLLVLVFWSLISLVIVFL